MHVSLLTDSAGVLSKDPMRGEVQQRAPPLRAFLTLQGFNESPERGTVSVVGSAQYFHSTQNLTARAGVRSDTGLQELQSSVLMPDV